MQYARESSPEQAAPTCSCWWVCWDTPWISVLPSPQLSINGSPNQWPWLGGLLSQTVQRSAPWMGRGWGDWKHSSLFSCSLSQHLRRGLVKKAGGGRDSFWQECPWSCIASQRRHALHCFWTKNPESIPKGSSQAWPGLRSFPREGALSISRSYSEIRSRIGVFQAPWRLLLPKNPRPNERVSAPSESRVCDHQPKS
jgi:hypothetical protein